MKVSVATGSRQEQHLRKTKADNLPNLIKTIIDTSTKVNRFHSKEERVQINNVNALPYDTGRTEPTQPKHRVCGWLLPVTRRRLKVTYGKEDGVPAGTEVLSSTPAARCVSTGDGPAPRGETEALRVGGCFAVLDGHVPPRSCPRRGQSLSPTAALLRRVGSGVRGAAWPAGTEPGLRGGRPRLGSWAAGPSRPAAGLVTVTSHATR